jgi:glycosyltransferase involved in cell wall biosynthesis
MQSHLLYLHNAEISSTMANVVQVVAMCKAWIQAGCRVTLVLRSAHQHDEKEIQQFKAQHGAPQELSIMLLPSSLPPRIHRHLVARKIPSLILSLSPDFCFVRDPAFFHAVLKTGTPVIMELHNTRLHLGSSRLDKRYHRIVIRGSKLPECLQIVAISAALADYWKLQGIPEKKMVVLHDGFTAGHFTEIPDRIIVRKQYELPIDKTIVVYTGNLQENRGIEYLIALAQRNPQVLFLAAGGSPDRVAHYRDYCQRESIHNLRFPGQLPHIEIPALLAAADALLAVWSHKVPTINVCSPLKVFEYMASGIPAVYPGYPTIHEVIQEGVNGFLATPDNIDSLNIALQKALALSIEERNQYFTNSREIAFGRYTWNSRVAEMVALLPENLKSA